MAGVYYEDENSNERKDIHDDEKIHTKMTTNKMK